MRSKKTSILLVVVMIATVFAVAVSANVSAQGSQTGMVSYWKFNEGSGSTTYDSESSNYGTLYGPSWTTGVEGTALSFDNLGGPTAYDYVEIPYSNDLKLTGSWSISAWLKPNSLADGLFPGRSWGKYFSQSQYWAEKSGIVLSVTGNYVKTYLYTGLGDPGWMGWDTEGFVANAFNDGGWHELLFSFNSESLILSVYVDNVLIGSKQIDGTVKYSRSQSTWLGRTGRGNDVWNPYSGEIDELKIYNIDIHPSYPVADAGPDQTVIVGEVVNFDGSGSYSTGGTIVSYDWDYGDGISGSGETPTHAYIAAGTYTVTLTVTDDHGESDSDMVIITVITPVQALQNLIIPIEEMGLPQGTENNLIQKLNDALHLLEMGNTNGAIHKLGDFIDYIEAQTGKKITQEQADFLIAYIQWILDNI